MICVIDFETSGKPPGNKVHHNTYQNFPRAVQFCGFLYDLEQNQEISRLTYLFKIDDFVIPEDSIKIHNITDEMVQQDGVYFQDVYENILNMLSEATQVVGHNLTFDLNVLRTELYHLYHNEMATLNRTVGIIDSLSTYCTMLKSTRFCNIMTEGRRYPKWPQLVELHEKLFSKPPDMTLHDASADCQICLKCFLRLQEVL